MSGGFRSIDRIVSNPNRKWRHTPTCLGLVLYSGRDSRRRSLEIQDNIDDVRQRGDVYEATSFGSSGRYSLRLNLEAGLMHCDCKSFEHRDGPCKHLTALAVMLVAEHEGGGSRYWTRASVLESRNSGDQYKLWEERPSVSDKIARDYGLEIVEVYECVQPVRGYRLHSGRIWTGAMPLPQNGEKVLAYLPNGEQVPSTIVRPFDEDTVYQAYVVSMEWIPDDYDDHETVLFGTEMLRSVNIHD